MWLLWVLFPIYPIHGASYYPPIEYEHDPIWSRDPWGYRELPDPKIAGTEYEVGTDSPDFRYPEPPFTAQTKGYYHEEQRPYRMSPAMMMYYAFDRDRPWFFSKKEDGRYAGCYCTTVYKRLTPLATCAVITTRHILTTATSTALILKDHGKDKTLENILGIWYDHDAYMFNSSMYATPCRIHFHPLFLRPENVNISHPLPVVYDVSVWATTYRFIGTWYPSTRAIVCPRGSSYYFQYSASTPKPGELAHIVGFQFIKAYGRKPMPWFRYLVRTKKHMQICPKTDWGWFHCVIAYWATYGLDSGAMWHRALRRADWRYDGLIAMHIFTLKLRSVDLIGYFQPIDTHAVLDFLYSAYMGWQKCEYLDWRFYDTSGYAPIPKPWFKVPWNYPWGVELYASTYMPYSK